MTAHAVSQPKERRRKGGFLVLPLTGLAILVLAAATFVSYVLWPTWPSTPASLDAPTIPITVAGVLFDVPPAAIRAAVQRHPGPQDRIDLAFVWPSLMPPDQDLKPPAKPADSLEADAAAALAQVNDRLFVTIAGLGKVLPPIERLRSIYPHYIETKATAGPDGLAIVPFRADTPYAGEDLIYLATNPEQFFARCTRPGRTVPGTCIHERSLDGAEITLRFPRQWLDDWRSVAAGFDRLIAQLHPQGG